MLTLLEKHMPSRVLKKTMSRDLKRISAGVSLVMLALGFSLLGILSFRNRLQGELATGSALEKLEAHSMRAATRLDFNG